MVRDLDNKQKIDKTLKLWMHCTGDDVEPSIEAPMERHLSKFQDPEQVWLGTRTFYAKLLCRSKKANMYKVEAL